MKGKLACLLMLLLALPILLSLSALTYGHLSLTITDATFLESGTVEITVKAEPADIAAKDVYDKIRWVYLSLNITLLRVTNGNGTKITAANESGEWLTLINLDNDLLTFYKQANSLAGLPEHLPINETERKQYYIKSNPDLMFILTVGNLQALWNSYTDVHQVDLAITIKFPKGGMNYTSSIYGTVEIQEAEISTTMHLDLDAFASASFIDWGEAGVASITDTWDVAEGCGDGYVSATEPFDAVFYGVPESVVLSVNETLARDSYGHVYIRNYVIYQDAGLNWSELGNATPNQIYGRLPERRTFTVLNGVPSPPAPSGVGLYAGHGFAINVGTAEYILHELAHGMGFCDPDPYGDLRIYWSGLYRATYLSQLTNSTWHLQEGDFHVWAYLASSPVYLSGNPGPLVLSMKTSESRVVSISVEVALGSVSPTSKQVTIGTYWTDVVFTYNPPNVDNLSVAEAVFTIKEDQSGLSRVITYYLTIMPQNWAEELNLTQEQIEQIWPSNWTELPEVPPLSQIPAGFWQQTLDMLNSYNWSSLNPYVAKAQENMEKAMEDSQLAQQTNNTCVKWLYSQAAQLRFYAAQLYTQAAQAWEQVQSSAQQVGGLWQFWPLYLTQSLGAGWDFAQLAAKASEYESKAAQLEMQAMLGCPEGFLSGKTGLNPFIGLGGILGLFGGNYSSLSWLIFIVGAVLALIGFLGLLFKQKSWTRMFPIGVVLCVIGLLLMGVI